MQSNSVPRVLCVEDDEDSREMLITLLRHALIDAQAVGSAVQAMSSIQAEPFDLYVLDSCLPDVDGFDLCRQIRDFDSDTPILFFSGAGYEADKKLGLEAGANAYVIKPDFDCLLRTIDDFVSRAEGAAVQTRADRKVNNPWPMTHQIAHATYVS